MFLPTLVGAVGLLVAAVEAAPRGTDFNKVRFHSLKCTTGQLLTSQNIGRGSRAFRAQVVARAEPDAEIFEQYQPQAKYTKPEAPYQPGPYYGNKNTSTSAISPKTLESTTLQCPTGSVYTSTKTVDITVTVTASSNVAYTNPYQNGPETSNSDPNFSYPPNKYTTQSGKPVYTGPDGEDHYGTAKPYYSVNSTIVPPMSTGYITKTTDGHSTETEDCTDEYPYVNSTIVAPVYTSPIDQYATPSGYPHPTDTVIYSAPPVYTKPAVYPTPVDPGNSKALYPVPSSPLNSAVVLPIIPTPSSESQAYVPSKSQYVPSFYSSPVVNSAHIPPAIPTPSPSGSEGYAPPVYTLPVINSIQVSPVVPTPSSIAYETPKSQYVPPVYSAPAVNSIATPYAPPTPSSSESLVYEPPKSQYVPPVYSAPVVNSPAIPPVASTPSSSIVYESPESQYVPPTANPTTSADLRPTVTPFLTTTLVSETATTETCIIDTSMIPVSTRLYNAATPTAPAYPAQTICEHTVEYGTSPKKDASYCGVNGAPVDNYLVAEFTEERTGVAVTAEGCYQFCNVRCPPSSPDETRLTLLKSDMDVTSGCQAYRFYHDQSGSPRCGLYGIAASISIRLLDSTVNDLWYDLACGSPSEEAWHEGASSEHQTSRSSGGASINVDVKLGF